MRLLFLGDIYGQAGRDAVIEKLATIKKDHAIDFSIANGENAAQFGITPDQAKELFEAGIDCLTTGNHAWSRREIIPFFEKEARIIRPVNYPEGTIGNGVFDGEDHQGRRIIVINVMGRVFMDPLDCPFRRIDVALRPYVLGQNVDAIFVDVHAETSSEKGALAHYLDGRISGIVGTHTHVPTADSMILPQGTAFQTDAGMCGAYNGVIGAQPEGAIGRFLKQVNRPHLNPIEGEATICGVVLELKENGLANTIYPIRVGGVLLQQQG